MTRVMEKDQRRTWSRDYAGQPDQVARARAFLSSVLDGCPVAADAVLLMSEIAANACLHLDSRRPGGRFTVRADASEDGCVRVEVTDQGGPWEPAGDRIDGRGHGLDIVTAYADDWGRHGDPAAGWTVWFRLRWPAPVTDGPRVPLPSPGSQAGQPAARPAGQRTAAAGRRS
jgi:hypothetical protein